MEFSLTINQGYIFVSSFLLTVGMLYIMLFFAFQRKISYVFFSLLCFFHIIKLIIRPDQHFLVIDPSWSAYFLSIKHLPFSLAGICLIGFMVYEFNLTHKLHILLAYAVTSLLFLLLKIPSFGLIIFSGLAIAIYSLKRDKQGGIYALVGLILFGIFTRLEFAQTLGISYYLGVIIFMIIMTLLVGQRIKLTIKRQREAQTKSVSLENQLLKSTIQPHFITNSLTSLQELIDTNPKAANEFIDNLAEELRLFSDMSQHKLVPVTQEVSLCKHHLEIMNQRMQGSYQLETKNIQGDEQIPPGIFHTLIENGLKHGFQFHQSGNFCIEKKKNGNSVVYEVSNDGQLVSDHEFSNGGTGFRYIKNRLTENYDSDWSFETDSTAGRYKVLISVPQ